MGYKKYNRIIEFKNHKIFSVRHYWEDSQIYNELFTCFICGWQGWNFDFIESEDILSCEEFIIKVIIE